MSAAPASTRTATAAGGGGGKEGDAARPRCLVLVTGASKGFGRALAVEFARRFGPKGPLTMALLARDAAGLEETRRLVLEVCGRASVLVHPADLSDIAGLDSCWDSLASAVGLDSPASVASLGTAILVNNAGSLGALCPTAALPSATALQKDMDLNVTSPMWLTRRFLAQVAPSSASASASASAESGSSSFVARTNSSAGAGASTASSDLPASFVVNISSLAAIQPFATWATYCAGKAARDMFLRVIQSEYASISKVKTLNYAPGPMATDMGVTIRSSSLVDPDIKAFHVNAFEEGKLVDLGDSAAKCARLIDDNRFDSGDHIDFYDEEPRAPGSEEAEDSAQ